MIVIAINIIAVSTIFLIANITKPIPAPKAPAVDFKSAVASIASSVEGFDFNTDVENLDKTSNDEKIIKAIDNIQSTIDVFLPSNERADCVKNITKNEHKILNFQWNYVDCYMKQIDLTDDTKRYLFGSLTLVCMMVDCSLHGAPIEITMTPTGIFSKDERIKGMFAPFLYGTSSYGHLNRADISYIDQYRDRMIEFVSKGTSLPVQVIRKLTSTNPQDRTNAEVAINNWNAKGIDIPFDILSIALIGYYVQFKNMLRSSNIKRCDLII